MMGPTHSFIHSINRLYGYILKKSVVISLTSCRPFLVAFGSCSLLLGQAGTKDKQKKDAAAGGGV